MKFNTKKERDDFILKYEYLIKTVIKNNPILCIKNSEDLYQTGWESLIKCVDKYEVIPNGAKFSNYAYRNIEGALFHFINDYRNGTYICLRTSDIKEKNRALSFEEDKNSSETSEDFVAKSWQIDKDTNVELECEDKVIKEMVMKELLEPKKSLRPVAKKMLELYYKKNLGFTEIGRIMGVPRQVVYDRIVYHTNRVIKKMRSVLNG